jgi:hypothetical protein
MRVGMRVGMRGTLCTEISCSQNRPKRFYLTSNVMHEVLGTWGMLSDLRKSVSAKSVLEGQMRVSMKVGLRVTLCTESFKLPPTPSKTVLSSRKPFKRHINVLVGLC